LPRLIVGRELQGATANVVSSYGVGFDSIQSIGFFSPSYPDLLNVIPRFPSGCVGEVFSLGIKIVGVKLTFIQCGD
jgi:hypothetical protein